MASKKQLTDEEKKEIVEAFKNGAKKAKLARQYKVNVKTIYNICKTGSTKRKNYNSENRFKLKDQDKIVIHNLSTKGISLREIKDQLTTEVSRATIRRHLKKEHCKPLDVDLNENEPIHKVNKIELSSLSLDIIMRTLKQIIFTNEIQISNSTLKKHGREYGRTNVSHLKPLKKITINIWGFLNWNEKKLFKIPKNFNSSEYFELLKNKGVLEFITNVIPGHLYWLQHNSKMNLTTELINLLKQKDIDLIENYRAYSSDLNKLNEIWTIFKKKVSIKLQNQELNDENELFNICQKCFNEISQQNVQKIISTLPLTILNDVEIPKI